jgi:GNAT superfamily N-acetyltransferase
LSEWRSPQPFDPKRHTTTHFDSGRPELDSWLRQYAGQNERRSAARSFVVTDEDERVIAFYTLVATEVGISEATPRAARGMSRHFPIPACRVVRLAVDRTEQGKGLGAAILADALGRAVRAAEQVGIRAIVVDAIDASAAEFYRRFGLEPVTDDSLLLMTTVPRVLDAVELAGRPRREADDLVAAEWWELRTGWAEVFVLLGGLGYRPKLADSGLVAYRDDGSALVLAGADDALSAARHEEEFVLRLVDAGGSEVVRTEISFAGDEDAVEAIDALSCEHPPAPPAAGFIRHSPPSSEMGRRKLSAAYAALLPELDALAAHGIHAYLELHGSGVRLFGDFANALLLEVTTDYDFIPAIGPIDDDSWVVFVDNEDGHEAELTVARTGRRVEDAETLARAVESALKRVLSGGHVLLEHYDPRLGRLDAGWY